MFSRPRLKELGSRELILCSNSCIFGKPPKTAKSTMSHIRVGTRIKSNNEMVTPSLQGLQGITNCAHRGVPI